MPIYIYIYIQYIFFQNCYSLFANVSFLMVLCDGIRAITIPENFTIIGEFIRIHSSFI